MGASQSTPPPAPAAAPAAKKADEFRFGQEETPKYGGAFKTKPIKRQLSSLPDAMMLYRVEARSARLAEKMDEDGETSEEIASRPKSARGTGGGAEDRGMDREETLAANA